MSKKKDLGELITNNIENAEELTAADKKVAFEKDNIEKNISKLILTNKKNADELIAAYKIIETQKKEINKQAEDLLRANREKEKRKADLVIAKKELAHKAKLIILNKKLLLANMQEKLTKEKYIELYNFAPTGYLTLTSEGKIIELNHFATQILGKDRSFLIDKRFGNFVTDDTKSIFNHFLEQVFKSKTKQIIDVTLLTDSDLPKYVYFSGIVTKNAEQCLVTIDDISERKHVEDALYESEERYSKAFQSSPYAISITSVEDGKFIEVNDAFTSISGFTREEALANSLIMLNMWVNIEEQKWVTSTLLDGKDVEGKEFLFKKKNGEIITGLFSAKIVKLNNLVCVLSSMNDITERKQAEVLLKNSEEKFHNLFNNSEVGMFRTRLDGSEVLEFNEKFLNILGYTNKEVKGKPSMKLWANEQEREKMAQLFKKKGHVTDFEFELLTKEGNVINCITSLRLYRDSGILEGSIQDITERKQMVENLQKSEIFLKEMQVIANLGTYTLDITSGRWISSEILDNIFGIDSDFDKSVEGWVSVIHPGWQKIMTDYFINEVVGNKSKFDKEYKIIRKKDKAERWLHGIGNLKFDENDRPIKMVGTIQDITEQKNAEETLIKAREIAEENEEKFRNLFEHSPIGKSMTGIDGSLHVNKTFCEIVGYSEEELRFKKWTEITYSEDIPQSNEIFQSIINGEKDQAFFEKRYIHKNGNIVWVDASTYLQRDIENKPQFFITTIIDRTARRRFEKELIAAKEKAEESDRLKFAFLANMSHEIRTPMNGILGFAELLKEPDLTIYEQQDYIQTIQISGARMLNTINSIVDMAKIESGLIGVNILETNLNEKIEFTYKFYKPEVEKKGLQFIVKNGMPTKEAVIRTDNEKVYAILTNLVRNAIKFTYDGSIEFGYEKKGEYLEFFVKDTGIGIPKNQYQTIFERFRQGSDSHNRGYEGSGLGLSISKSYVEMLGGSIWVESEEGLGSTFYFTIPYIAVSEEKPPIEQVVSSKHKEVQLKNLKILIVEDDEISYSLLSRTLQEISKEVLHVITGVQAVEACRNNPDLDLVLMDIRMPQMNGLEATQQIRQFNKDVIIIAQTAYAFAGDSEKAIEAGCNDYISKPINKTLLYELIYRHCNKSKIC